MVDACNADFAGEECERIRLDLWSADKYGNDLDGADGMASDLCEYVAKGIRNRGIAKGMGHYLIVISSSQTNTDWGHFTAASPDKRQPASISTPRTTPRGERL